MGNVTFIPKSAFDVIRSSTLSEVDRLSLLADMCRVNALGAIKQAGSGHIGSSFSALDVMVTLYFSEMNTLELGFSDPNRDIFFSSKGHDAPGFYSVLYAAGILEEQAFFDLRRIRGVPGHPDVTVTGVETNSGSLGMGISKGRGMALAKALSGHNGRIYVMVGDGELQEGQNYEALQNAVAQGLTNLTVFVDFNKVQSDRLVLETLDLGEIEQKFQAFGWAVARCDGHDIRSLLQVLETFRAVSDKPRICICDTVKGRGVSFMEHPYALDQDNGLYKWHSGAPTDDAYEAAVTELTTRINERAESLGIEAPTRKVRAPAEASSWSPSEEFVAEAYGKRLVELGAKHQKLVVLDADLALDCRIWEFRSAFPDRFIENGIAEQDMVSMAGGLALHGHLPVVNSFACFLSSRAHEQVFINTLDRTKIIYVNHFAGILPAGPGATHQSLRDIALFSALPQCLIVQPVNSHETVVLLDYLVETAGESSMMRLLMGPSPKAIDLPPDYEVAVGRGTVLHEGTDAVMFTYGPVMTAQALDAAARLEEESFGLRVVTTPWLNRIDMRWLERQIASIELLFVLEDHGPVGGFGDFLFNAMAHADLIARRRFRKIAIEGYPACGTPPEVLDYHGVDGAAVAQRVLQTALSPSTLEVGDGG